MPQPDLRRPLAIDPARTAALFVDLQEEHRGDRRCLVEGFERVIANVRRFRPALPDGTSAFSDSNDPLTALCGEVAPKPGETLLVKAEASAFGAASPEADLRGRGRSISPAVRVNSSFPRRREPRSMSIRQRADMQTWRNVPAPLRPGWCQRP